MIKYLAMSKIILLTGATDGIGLEAARLLVTQGHQVLLHGRNATKLEKTQQLLSAIPGEGCVETYIADLSNLADVTNLAHAIAEKRDHLDVLINNAGVLKSPQTRTPDGLDVRFVVNTLAPYLLTQSLLPLMGTSGRVINVSSAGQQPVNLQALAGRVEIADDYTAYAQSKLALNMWSRHLALALNGNGPSIVAVNPGSLLGTKMVQEGFGLAGNDIGIGADILVRAALSDEFAKASGLYFDNDKGQFAAPHPDALDVLKCREIVRLIEEILATPGIQLNQEPDLN
jgi:NAD(P)-dependent dehydrogenase (short-subunit alcohol dehydrogenase family)